jgi:hypothetical protein
MNHFNMIGKLTIVGTSDPIVKIVSLFQPTYQCALLHHTDRIKPLAADVATNFKGGPLYR